MESKFWLLLRVAEIFFKTRVLSIQEILSNFVFWSFGVTKLKTMRTVGNTTRAFCEEVCLMLLIMQSLYSHWILFSGNLATESEEQHTKLA